MRIALSCLALLGLSVALNAQVTEALSEPAASVRAQQLQAQTTSTTLPDGRHAVDMQVVATGGVEIQIGSHVVTADEAVIKRIPFAGDEIELRGHVRLKGAASAQASEPAASVGAQQLQAQTTATTLPDGRHAVDLQVVATGGVEIQIGSHVVTADEAVIKRIPFAGDEIELRGHVRLKGRVAFR